MVVWGGLLARGSPERQPTPPLHPSTTPPHHPRYLTIWALSAAPAPRTPRRPAGPTSVSTLPLRPVAASSHVRQRSLAGPSVWGRKSRRGLAGAGGAGSRLPAAQTVGTRFNWPKTQQDGGTAALAEEAVEGRGWGGLRGAARFRRTFIGSGGARGG